MGDYPLKKTQNMEWVFTIEFIVGVKTKSPEFWNEDEIWGYDDLQALAKCMKCLPKCDSMEVVDRAFFVPQKPRFYFLLSFCIARLSGFWTSHSFLSFS